MKTKQFCLILLFVCLSIAAFAQAQFTSAGIAVQGIVRDENNTAIQNRTIDLTFTFYYTTNSVETAVGTPITKSVVTDGFGVFSSIIDPGTGNNLQFSNNPVSLRITKGSFIISESLLQNVPYAIAANNGVPTGFIMPFAGSVAPNGWALCNGAALPANATELKALLASNNAPDLRGFFLRGAGTNTVAGYTTNVGPNLNQRQQDDNLSHNHSINHGHGITDPGHAHSFGKTDSFPGIYLPGSDGYPLEGAGTPEQNFTMNPSPTGVVVNNFVGSSEALGTESRPVNYGVNYIIKL
ncbi:MAG: tail fiber protein [Flavobacteriaceae bacterium]|nr:tail fiber protein [Flavobacteriaceae bacterium]